MGDIMNNEIFIDENEEELKKIANNIRKYSNDLNIIKEKADQEWSDCSKFLDDTTNQNINMIKKINNKKYLSDIEKLDNYANKIDFVSNVLKDTEIEIRSSAKKFENLFEKINNNILNILYKKK